MGSATPDAGAGLSTRDLEVLRRRRPGRAWGAVRGLREAVLIVAVYSLYDVSRYLVAGDRDAAVAHGRTLLRFEQRIGLAPEHALNRFLTPHVALALPADYIYATLHYVVTPAVLIWLWRSHAAAYSQARFALVAATILGLVGFSLLPVAPPRLLPGFVDTMAHWSRYGWWGTDASAPRGLGGATNEYAALPSLHVGWAVWSGWYLARYGAHRGTRIAGAAYPVLVAMVVMSTANHYLIDVVAGVAVMAFSGGFVMWARSLEWRAWPRTRSGSPSSSSPSAPA